MFDSLTSSAVQLVDTSGFQVRGETGGTLRALEITTFRNGKTSSKFGTVVKDGGESLTGGGAAMKVATGSGRGDEETGVGTCAFDSWVVSVCVCDVCLDL